MKRVEIILNEAVESDLLIAFAENNAVPMFTRIPNVHGQGYSDPKRGDEVWPQQNVIIIVYCEDTQLTIISDIVRKLRNQYKNDGIAMFATDAENLLH